MKSNSIFRIFILILLIVDFYLMTSKFDSFDNYGQIFFISISFIVSVIVLPLEISNIFGLCTVFALRKFNWIRLFFLLPALIELMNASMYSVNRTVWYGLDMHHLAALSWGLLILLYRDNYIMISDKKIKIQGMGGWIDSIKIKWSDLTNIENEDDLTIITSNDKKIEIKHAEIKDSQLKTILRLIENQVTSTGHNNAYKKLRGDA